TIELALDAVVARDAAALGDVQRTFVEDDAVRRIEAFQDRLDLALAALVGHRIDVLRVAVADEHRAVVAERERARFGDAVHPGLDLEAARNLERVERQL